MSIETNLISVELSDEVLNSSVDNIKLVETNLQFLLTIKTEDKTALAKIGPRTIDFMDKTYDFAFKNPLLRPQFFNLVEFEKDLNLVKQLQVLRNHLIPLTNMLNDTFAVVGAEAYLAARVFYHHVRNAARANIPGASAIADELGKLFAK